MFAFKSRKEVETTFRILLITVILFNALMPGVIAAQARQASATTTNSKSQITKQDDDPIPPTFERPVPRVGVRDFGDSSNISAADPATKNNTNSSPLSIKNTKKLELEAKLQARQEEAKTKLNDAKQKIKSFKPAPNPVRKITQKPQSPANSQGKKDVFKQHAGSQERIFTVTTLDDHDDGICDNDCSLREAIYAANNLPGADTIFFSVSGTILLNTALPYMTDTAGLTLDSTKHDVTISGKNLTSVLEENSVGILDAKSTGKIERVIKHGRRTISTKGLSQPPANVDELSSAIDDALLVSDSSTVLGPDPEDCDIYDEGSLTISGSYEAVTICAVGGLTISSATFYDVTAWTQGTLSVSNSTINSSSVWSDGSAQALIVSGSTLNFGAVWHEGAMGTLTVSNSILLDASAIWNEGDLESLTVTNSDLRDVSAVWNDGDLGSLTVSSSNLADSTDIWSQGTAQTLTISDTTLTEDSGIWINGGTITISESTFLSGSYTFGDNTVDITDSIFSESNVFSGGAINIAQSDFSLDSYALTNDGSSTIDITDSSFADSYADSGGATSITDSTFSSSSVYSIATMAIANSIFFISDIYGNNVTIANDVSLTIANSTFLGNAATTPTTWTGDPFTGSVPVSGDLASITNSAFVGSLVTSNNALSGASH